MDKKNTVWGFDLGKGSIGEAVRQGMDFPHVASFLIPPNLARRGPASASGTPANRYRAMKTRDAHKAREGWLDVIWKAAGFEPLPRRQVIKVNGKWQAAPETEAQRNLRSMLEREFPEPGDETYYTSCLLRIKLLRGEKLEPWQVYKALRSALQRRGYGRVPWAAKEAQRVEKTVEELEREEEKKLQQADPRYREAVGRWPKFKSQVPQDYHFPCYYDAWKMSLWDPMNPQLLKSRQTHAAESTRNVRFDRADVRAEVISLGDAAAAIIPALGKAFQQWKEKGWTIVHPVTGKEQTFPVRAKTFGEFLCDGPSGTPDESSFEAYLKNREEAGIRRGTYEEWMSGLGQKTPNFDNLILDCCTLIPRYHVCKIETRLVFDARGKPSVLPDSLLPSEVIFLLKLKNLLVAVGNTGQRKLNIEEIRKIFQKAHEKVSGLDLMAKGALIKRWRTKVADCFSIKESDWGSKKGLYALGLRPLPNHEQVKAPKISGRCGFSRVALRIIRELILSGKSPSEFHDRLLNRESELLGRLGAAPDKPLLIFDDSIAKKENQRRIEDRENSKKGVLASELRFLLRMKKEKEAKDTWENIFIPSQRLEAIQQRHIDSEAAIRELLGTIKDPIVRHRKVGQTAIWRCQRATSGLRRARCNCAGIRP